MVASPSWCRKCVTQNYEAQVAKLLNADRIYRRQTSTFFLKGLNVISSLLTKGGRKTYQRVTGDVIVVFSFSSDFFFVLFCFSEKRSPLPTVVLQFSWIFLWYIPGRRSVWHSQVVTDDWNYPSAPADKEMPQHEVQPDVITYSSFTWSQHFLRNGVRHMSTESNWLCSCAW